MDDRDVDDSEVLQLVREELARLRADSPEAVREVEAALDEALREGEVDEELAGATALATLLEIAGAIGQERFGRILRDLSQTLGVQIDDIQYVDNSVDGPETLSLREHLPAQASMRIEKDDWLAIETFIDGVVKRPPFDPDSGPEQASDPGSDTPVGGPTR